MQKVVENNLRKTSFEYVLNWNLSEIRIQQNPRPFITFLVFTSSTNDDHPGGTPGFGGGWFNPRPRPGPSHTGSTYSQGYQDAGCGATNNRSSRPGTGGFWTGMAAGGLLGYMAGNSG